MLLLFEGRAKMCPKVMGTDRKPTQASKQGKSSHCEQCLCAGGGEATPV